MKKIKVTDQLLHTGRISRFIYGDFVEFVDNLTGGMWAEKIRCRSFEDVLPPAGELYYRRDVDFKKYPWYESGFKDKAEYSLDEKNPFVGKRSQRITIVERCGGEKGISQDGIFVEKGKSYRVELILKQSDMRSEVKVLLGRDRGSYFSLYASCSFRNIGNEWKKFTAKVISTVTDTNATFSIRFANKGTLWIGKVSLMSEDAKEGWRADVVDAVRKLKPGILRFGGSSLHYYHWKDGIGPRDTRVPFCNKPWGEIESNDVGLDEFITFCHLTRSEPLICVNATTGTPEEAANEVEYCNGSPDTKYGKLRAKYCHPEPYRVKYWQVGNELSGKEYERKLPEFCKAMKGKDPAIKLISSFPSEGVLKVAGEYLDYLAPHYYLDSRRFKDIEEDINRLRMIIRKFDRKSRIKLAVTEWNSNAGDWGLNRAFMETTGNGLLGGHYFNLFQRNSDIVEIANRSNLTNSWFSGAIQTNNSGMYFSPMYYVQQLYSHHSGVYPLKIGINRREYQSLDISASLNARQDKVHIMAVNDEDQCVKVHIDLSDFGRIRHKAMTWTVSGSDKLDINDFCHPQTIHTISWKINDCRSRFQYIFPPISITAIECYLKCQSRPARHFEGVRGS